MVLKAMKNSLKKIVRKNIFVKKKKFYEKTNSDKNFFLEFSKVWKFSEVPKFGYFPKVM